MNPFNTPTTLDSPTFPFSDIKLNSDIIKIEINQEQRKRVFSRALNNRSSFNLQPYLPSPICEGTTEIRFGIEEDLHRVSTRPISPGQARVQISRRVATNFSSLQGEIRGERSAQEEEAEVERQKRGTEAARSRRAAAVD